MKNWISINELTNNYKRENLKSTILDKHEKLNFNQQIDKQLKTWNIQLTNLNKHEKLNFN